MTLSCNITSGGPVTDWKWEKDMVTRLITITHLICVCFVCLLMLISLALGLSTKTQVWAKAYH